MFERDVKNAVALMGLELGLLMATSGPEIDEAFAKTRQKKPDALIIGADPLFIGLASEVAEFALQFRIPSIYQFLDFAEAGALCALPSDAFLGQEVGWMSCALDG